MPDPAMRSGSFTAALAEFRGTVTTALAEMSAAMQAGFGEAAKKRAELGSSAAGILSVTVSTIVTRPE